MNKELFELMMKQANENLMVALENSIQSDIGCTRQEANRVANHILDILDAHKELKEDKKQLLDKNEHIIQFTDADVDGCGTNVIVYFKVIGSTTLTDEIINGMESKIEEYKKENYGEWSTDDILDAACDYLQEQGFDSQVITPNYYVEF